MYAADKKAETLFSWIFQIDIANLAINKCISRSFRIHYNSVEGSCPFYAWNTYPLVSTLQIKKKKIREYSILFYREIGADQIKKKGLF